jgi:hypothetical protein
MSERSIVRAARLPGEVLVIDAGGEKKLHQLKCSRRKFGLLLEALERPREPLGP